MALPLELRLFGEADDNLKLDAAGIYAAGIYPKLLSLPLEKRPESSVKPWLEALVEESESYITVVAVGSEGKAAAIYQLWPFSNQNGCLENSSYGSLTAEPRGKGIGSEFLGSLKRIFEHLAFVSGCPELRHNELTHNASSFFLRNGYAGTGISFGPWRAFSKSYFPCEHSLSASEQRIILEFMKFLPPKTI